MVEREGKADVCSFLASNKYVHKATASMVWRMER